MSEESKRVVCLHCGNHMTLEPLDEAGHFAATGVDQHWYECYICGSRTPIADSEAAAYAAATQRPPNLPLTREQVEAMDDLDAVWEVFAFWNLFKRVDILIITGDTAKKDYTITSLGDILMFSRRPTNDDISAALPNEAYRLQILISNRREGSK